MIFLGIFATLGLTVNSIILLVNRIKTKARGGTILHEGQKRKLTEDILVVVFIIPCLLYFIKALGQYDQNLRAKRRQVQQERMLLIKSYENTLRDMDAFLKTTSERTGGFAERGFETQRRDFIWFLQHCRGHVVAEELQELLLPQMKAFCFNWFRAFQECSIDPIDNPLIFISEEELNRCITLDEVYNYCLHHLMLCQVKFLQDRFQDERNRINEDRERLEFTSPMGALLEKQSREVRGGRRKTSPWALALNMQRTGTHCMNQISWLTFGCRCDWHIEAKLRERGYPKVFNFGCGCLVLLSREHVALLCGFCFGWAIFIIELVSEKIRPVSLATILVVEFILFWTLVRFEAIDILQRLEREKKKLEDAKEEVHRKQAAMEDFWKPIQNLYDLWHYRTTPVLAIFTELQHHLEDIDNPDAIDQFMLVNCKMQALTERLGNLGDWCSDGQISIEQKKQCEHHLGVVVEMAGLSEIGLALSQCVNEVGRILPPPVPSISGFLRGATPNISPSPADTAAQGSQDDPPRLSGWLRGAAPNTSASLADTAAQASQGALTLPQRQHSSAQWLQTYAPPTISNFLSVPTGTVPPLADTATQEPQAAADTQGPSRDPQVRRGTLEMGAWPLGE